MRHFVETRKKQRIKCPHLFGAKPDVEAYSPSTNTLSTNMSTNAWSSEGQSGRASHSQEAAPSAFNATEVRDFLKKGIHQVLQ